MIAGGIDALLPVVAGVIDGEILGAINFGKTLELAGIGRPLHGISAALNASLALPIVFDAQSVHDLPALQNDNPVR